MYFTRARRYLAKIMQRGEEDPVIHKRLGYTLLQRAKVYQYLRRKKEADNDLNAAEELFELALGIVQIKVWCGECF